MKTLLVDLSQVILAPITVQQFLDENLIKHIALNSIRSLAKKFKGYNIVLCSDSKNYWRKDVFAYYKENRKENRIKSNLDWDLIFKTFNQLKIDLKENFPYKFVEVYGAEADDVIAILSYYVDDEIVICSSDSDYKQLHILPNVRQYNPTLDVFIKSSDPKKDLKEKIIKGDRGDNIPSIMSPDNIFALKKRQSPISSKKLEIWLEEEDMKSVLSEEQYRNYLRNDLLINFKNIPQYLKDEIIKQYDAAMPHPKKKIYDYLVANKMVELLSDIQDF